MRGRLRAPPIIAGLMAAFPAACSAGADAPGDLPDDLDLSAATSIHRISLGGWGSEERVVPDRLRAEVGTVVIFQVSDQRVHTIRFLAEEMTEAQVRHMNERFQLASPPLIRRDSRFVVTFDGAPTGVYPYAAEGFGESTRGSITIEPSASR